MTVLAVIIGVTALVTLLAAVWILVLSDRQARKGHVPTAYECRYWTGDRAGTDLSDRCPICDP